MQRIGDLQSYQVVLHSKHTTTITEAQVMQRIGDLQSYQVVLLPALA